MLPRLLRNRWPPTCVPPSGRCGSRAFSSILGLLIIFYNLGAVVGPPVAGWISDTTGSFYWVFVLSIAAYLVSSLLVALGAKPRSQGEP